MYHRNCTSTTKTTCNRWVFVSVTCSNPLTHAEHEETLTLVSFRIRIVSAHTNAHRTRKDTHVGVFSWLVGFLRTLMPACFCLHWCPPNMQRHQHLVSLRVQRLFYTQWGPGAHRTQRDIPAGVLLCSATFLHASDVWGEGFILPVESFQCDSFSKYLYYII
jgi:hypothetical protein